MFWRGEKMGASKMGQGIRCALSKRSETFLVQIKRRIFRIIQRSEEPKSKLVICEALTKTMVGP